MKKFENKGQKLPYINNEIPFRVPEDYFDGFPSKLAEAIRRQYRVSSSKKFLNAWKPYAAAAILIVVVVLAATLTGRNRTPADQRRYSETFEWLESELHSINEQTLLEISEMKEPELTEDSTLNSDEVIRYLLNEDFENELNNEL